LDFLGKSLREAGVLLGTASERLGVIRWMLGLGSRVGTALSIGARDGSELTSIALADRIAQACGGDGRSSPLSPRRASPSTGERSRASECSARHRTQGSGELSAEMAVADLA